MQGAYIKDAKVPVNLKMQTNCTVQKGYLVRTGQESNPSAAFMHSTINGNLHKFRATYTQVKFYHQCKVHMKRKLRCW